MRLRHGGRGLVTVMRNPAPCTRNMVYPWWIKPSSKDHPGVGLAFCGGSYTSAGRYLLEDQSQFDIIAIEECIPTPDPSPAPTVDLSLWEGKKARLRLRDGSSFVDTVEKNCGLSPKTYPWRLKSNRERYTASGQYLFDNEDVRDIVAVEPCPPDPDPAPTVDLSLWEGKLVRVRFRDGKVKGDVRIESVDDSNSYPWRLCPGDHLLDRYTKSGRYYTHKLSNRDIVAIEPMLSDPKSEQPSRASIRVALADLEASALLIQRKLKDLRRQLED